MRVARHYFSVALLGTNLNLDQIYEVLKISDNVVLALDRDATRKALALQARFKFIAPNLRVVLLDKDLKYLNDAEIKEKVA